MQNVVETLAKRRSGGNHLERFNEPGLLSILELSSEFIPGSLRHQTTILSGDLASNRDD
jgi:hypothetical protein